MIYGCQTWSQESLMQDIMMMTFMEVKGHQRSNVINYMFYGYQTWSEESLMQVYDNDDLHGGQRSSEVKGSKLCAMVTKLGQKIPDASL